MAAILVHKYRASFDTASVQFGPGNPEFNLGLGCKELRHLSGLDAFSNTTDQNASAHAEYKRTDVFTFEVDGEDSCPKRMQLALGIFPTSCITFFTNIQANSLGCIY